ncbi:hypothetical protein FA15DRAFT_657531 [Coprinopsis marcescibilis]|uniref:Uncharacterized protein n=1 Tax=Coprinopsis marcescibilis TaxID=230819 RepID=A0A5C3KPW0_COPMA|nr:hypothetical protein FA15DRAFT_657531 [Coprinopsis marcescibilis]
MSDTYVVYREGTIQLAPLSLYIVASIPLERRATPHGYNLALYITDNTGQRAMKHHWTRNPVPFGYNAPAEAYFQDPVLQLTEVTHDSFENVVAYIKIRNFDISAAVRIENFALEAFSPHPKGFDCIVRNRQNGIDGAEFVQKIILRLQTEGYLTHTQTNLVTCAIMRTGLAEANARVSASHSTTLPLNPLPRTMEL